jgi:clan AA aspartic protease
MGTIFYTTRVVGPKGEQTLEFLVDTGSGYTLLPNKVWKRIGLKPSRKETFTLADGTHVSRNMAECQIVIEGEIGHTPVVLGEKEDSALLGVITLEEFGLMINPFSRRLQPMKLMLT